METLQKLVKSIRALGVEVEAVSFIEAMGVLGPMALSARGCYTMVQKETGQVVELIVLIDNAFDPYQSEMDAVAVLIHELAHATGHKSRLSRGLERRMMHGESDRQSEALEEVIAETACGLVLEQTGLASEVTRARNKRYIENFSQGLSQIEMARAYGEALKAAAWIMDNVFQSETKKVAA